MKKCLTWIIVGFLTFFAFQEYVFADSNQCSLQDKNKWTYKGSYNASKDEKGEKDGKLIHCCTKSDGSWVCDEYESKTEQSSGGTQGSGSATQSASSASNVNVCSDASLIPTYKFLGQIIRIAKIFIPIIIIGFGMVDLFGALTSAKPEEITKSVKTLIYRVVAGILIFFLPAIINLIFSFIDNWSTQYENETKSCFNCIWDVNNC